MSLPGFSTQSELFSTAALSGNLFPEADRYRLFAKLIYPAVVACRAALEKCYCSEDGRPGIEPVLLVGVSILQEWDGMPDRKALEMLRYHAGWNFALNRQLGDELFHPTTLVNFRNRLTEHRQSALGSRQQFLRRFGVARRCALEYSGNVAHNPEVGPPLQDVQCLSVCMDRSANERIPCRYRSAWNCPGK